MVSVVQWEWAAKNPRATFKVPIIAEDVLNSRMIAYQFRLLQLPGDQWRRRIDPGLPPSAAAQTAVPRSRTRSSLSKFVHSL